MEAIMLTDVYVKTQKEAMEEIARRRSIPEGADLIHRYNVSPYGGYKVHSFSPDLALEFAFDGVDSEWNSSSNRRYG